MCASYMIKTRNPGQWGLPIDQRIQDIDQYFDKKMLPRSRAPVVRSEDKKNVLTLMMFSLIPRWSDTSRPKFATHNARLDAIDVKPTWRDAFKKRHCLVPISEFYEAIYTGEHAGHMVAFESPDAKKPIWAAGIWEEWTDKETGEIIESFSIITSEPTRFVKKIGHDRSPLFLAEGPAQEWLELPAEESQEFVGFLKNNRIEPELTVRRDRPMKPGWEKRR